jgi:malonyl CoA-acyl carrier protein transacylase
MARIADVNTALLFPGQGAQKPGMLHELIDDSAVELTLDEISDVLGTDVRLLDSPEALNSTVSVQVALLASGVATAKSFAETWRHLLRGCGSICRCLCSSSRC